VAAEEAALRAAVSSAEALREILRRRRARGAPLRTERVRRVATAADHQRARAATTVQCPHHPALTIRAARCSCWRRRRGAAERTRLAAAARGSAGAFLSRSLLGVRGVRTGLRPMCFVVGRPARTRCTWCGWASRLAALRPPPPPRRAVIGRTCTYAYMAYPPWLLTNTLPRAGDPAVSFMQLAGAGVVRSSGVAA
jgi:hypothetical protein